MIARTRGWWGLGLLVCLACASEQGRDDTGGQIGDGAEVTLDAGMEQVEPRADGLEGSPEQGGEPLGEVADGQGDETAATHCGDQVLAQGEACEQDHHCPAGLICDQCQCVPRACDDDAACDDGNPCTRGQCVDQVCQVDLLDDVPCPDDGAVCTDDRCVAGACVHRVLAGGACDDGDPCTILTTCDEGGNCVGPVPGDADDDNVLDPCDDCPDAWDPSQEDFDNDGIGDACDDQPGPWTSCPAVNPPFFEQPSGCIEGDLSLFDANLGPQADGVCWEGSPPLPKSGVEGLLELLVPPDWWLSVGYRIQGRLPGLFVITGCQVEWVDDPACYGDNWNPSHAPVGALPQPDLSSEGAWRRTGLEVLPNAPGKVVSVWFDTVTELITVEEPDPLPYRLCWQVHKGAPEHDRVDKALQLQMGVPHVLESWRHATDKLDGTTCTKGGEGLAGSPDLAFQPQVEPGKSVSVRLEPWNRYPADLAAAGVRLLLVNAEGRCEEAREPDETGAWTVSDWSADTPTLVIEAGTLITLLADLLIEPAP